MKKTPDETRLKDTVADSNEEALTEEEIASNVDAIMKKYDRESNVRIWEGAPKWIVSAILASFSLLCLYIALL